mmetsp:Transcript_99907/g.213910  ORF Transcript_99907/g.213910 Transcript_99907/m.213910 type:complete len:379 (-) Transcript_99907:108-1244(-)
MADISGMALAHGAVATKEDEQLLPRGFGIARTEDLGTASHELIYEHEYHPQPIREYSTEIPAESECGSWTPRGTIFQCLLRPAVRNGRVAFRFFGYRVPLSADHARCWLGYVLLNETRMGRLQRVELIVRQGPGDPPPSQPALGYTPYALQPSWLWHAWPPGPDVDGPRRPQPVAVMMTLSPMDGVTVELKCENLGHRAHVYRVLRQYCDDYDGSDWHPIPEPAGRITKVHNRDMASDILYQRMVGRPVPESGGEVLTRSMDQIQAVETRVHKALSRVETSREVANTPDFLLYLEELKVALEAAQETRMKLRPEWDNLANQGIEAFLGRALNSQGDREFLLKAKDMALRFKQLGVTEPASLARAEKVLLKGEDGNLAK